MPAAEPVALPPNETIDQAWDLGVLNQPSAVVGSVGLGPEGPADVTWYHFQLQDAARVDLSVSAAPGDRPFASVLSVFNSDPQDWEDPYDPTGHRLIAQVQADPKDGQASYVQKLGPGDYFVAISGAGNTAFSPVIAGSGFQGAMGSYELTVGATDLGLNGDGPTMLWADPATGAVLDSSPLAIRVEMSGPLDPATISAGQTVQLLQVSAGGVETPVPLATTNLSTNGEELQLFPLAPLAPGVYVVQLSGDSSQGQPALAGPNGVPLGQDAQHPDGADESFTFQIAGIDGVAGTTASDDTAATAHDLGNLVGAGLVQVSGAIGVDPAFNPMLSFDAQGNPANQVDLYHFRITGPGRYAMLSEVFAGRIGSPLDPGVSLYELDPSTGTLVFLAGNNNTLDNMQGTDGSVPLFTDSALTAGLTAGDYYLAVADGSNTPSPLEGQMPGTPGIFDPNQPGSAQLGSSTGPYLLNLMVQRILAPPRVVASTPSRGQVLGQAPTEISVRFSAPVDLQQLAYQAFAATGRTTLSQVFVEGRDGQVYPVRLLSDNRATNTATFQMLDGLPNGSYTLHLSGAAGLTDLAGNPLVGNDPSGDDVVPFEVQGPDRGLLGSASGRYYIFSQAGGGVSQDIGVLFPDELQAGVSILRYPQSGAVSGSAGMRDTYVIQVLQGQTYSFRLLGADLPAGVEVTATGASGQPVPLLPTPDGRLFFAPLQAGTYTVSVGGWAAGEAAGLSYQLVIKLNGYGDNPPPLVDGPAPALQVSFDTAFATPGTPSVGAMAPSGESATIGPVAGEASGSVEGAAGASVATGTGSSSGGPVPAAPSESPVVSFSQTQAAVGLAGLGMGPLGGIGGQAGPLSAPSVQVALSMPSTSATSSGAMAVGLVTLTQVFAWSGDGEATQPAEIADSADFAADAPPLAIEDVAPSEESGPPVGPTDDSHAAFASLATPTVPAPVLAAWLDLPGVAGPVPADGASVPPVDSPAPPAGGPSPPFVTGKSSTRWAIAAATLAAVYRARGVVRGLHWKKGARASVLDVRSIMPIRSTVRPGGTIEPDPAARPRPAHVVIPRPRGGLHAALPRH